MSSCEFVASDTHHKSRLYHFCAVFNYPNRASKEKDKSNYRFASIVENNGKEDPKLSKVK